MNNSFFSITARQFQTSQSHVKKDSAYLRRGVVKQGSCSDCVEKFLKSVYPNFKTRHEILVNNKHLTPKSIDWALYYLHSIGKIERRSNNDPRSSLYLRYRAVREHD